MAVAAFWLALAAIIIAMNWRKTQIEHMRHITLRLLIEKNQQLDQKQLQELLNPGLLDGHPLKQSRGEAYVACRVIGVITMFTAPAMGVAVAIVHHRYHDGLIVGIGLLFIGMGVFFASRFTTPPAAQ